MGHRADGRIGTAERRRRARAVTLDELTDGLIPEMLGELGVADHVIESISGHLSR
jgi:hypothetical protein